jgi:hypothetical protein
LFHEGTWRDEVWPDNWTAVTQVWRTIETLPMHIFAQIVITVVAKATDDYNTLLSCFNTGWEKISSV